MMRLTKVENYQSCTKTMLHCFWKKIKKLFVCLCFVVIMIHLWSTCFIAWSILISLIVDQACMIHSSSKLDHLLWGGSIAKWIDCHSLLIDRSLSLSVSCVLLWSWSISDLHVSLLDRSWSLWSWIRHAWFIRQASLIIFCGVAALPNESIVLKDSFLQKKEQNFVLILIHFSCSMLFCLFC